MLTWSPRRTAASQHLLQRQDPTGQFALTYLYLLCSFQPCCKLPLALSQLLFSATTVPSSVARPRGVCICGGLATAATAVQHSTPQPFRQLASPCPVCPVLHVTAALSVMSGLQRPVVLSCRTHLVAHHGPPAPQCVVALLSCLCFVSVLVSCSQPPSDQRLPPDTSFSPSARPSPSLLPAPPSSACVGRGAGGDGGRYAQGKAVADNVPIRITKPFAPTTRQ
jgi:hypothetical protein